MAARWVRPFILQPWVRAQPWAKVAWATARVVPFAVCGGVVAVAVPFVVSADKTDFMAAGMEFVVVCEVRCLPPFPCTAPG
jgi:hypothetical protein